MPQAYRGIFDRWLVIDEMLPWVKRQEMIVNAPSRSVPKSIPSVIGNFGEYWQDLVYMIGRFTLHFFIGLLNTSPSTAPGTNIDTRLLSILRTITIPPPLIQQSLQGYLHFRNGQKNSQDKLKYILLVRSHLRHYSGRDPAFHFGRKFLFRIPLLHLLAVGRRGPWLKQVQ